MTEIYMKEGEVAAIGRMAMNVHDYSLFGMSQLLVQDRYKNVLPLDGRLVLAFQLLDCSHHHRSDILKRN